MSQSHSAEKHSPVSRIEEVPDDDGNQLDTGSHSNGNGFQVNRVPTCISMTNKYKILLVDDEPYNIYYLKVQLSRMGLAAQIETAANGKQAIHQLQRNLGIKTHKNNLEGYVFKLIFMDVNMPIMNGFQTTREIVRLYTENQYPIRPYILSYTAYNDFETKQECVLAGSHDVIQKPCPMDLLVSVVEEYYFNAEVIGPKKEGSG